MITKGEVTIGILDKPGQGKFELIASRDTDNYQTQTLVLTTAAGQIFSVSREDVGLEPFQPTRRSIIALAKGIHKQCCKAKFHSSVKLCALLLIRLNDPIRAEKIITKVNSVVTKAGIKPSYYNINHLEIRSMNTPVLQLVNDRDVSVTITFQLPRTRPQTKVDVVFKKKNAEYNIGMGDVPTTVKELYAHVERAFGYVRGQRAEFSDLLDDLRYEMAKHQSIYREQLEELMYVIKHDYTF